MTNVAAPTSLGELSGLLSSWRIHPEAAKLSPRTIRAYTDVGALFAAFLADKACPPSLASVASMSKRSSRPSLIAPRPRRPPLGSPWPRYALR